MPIEEYLFRKAEKPSENLRNLLGTFMQIQQMKKEEGQRMWERGIKEREVTGREKLWGAQAEYYKQRPTTTGRPDLIARGGWSPKTIQDVLDHWGMDITTFRGFSSTKQGELIREALEGKIKSGEEKQEEDRNTAEAMIGDIGKEMDALGRNFGIDPTARAEYDKLQKITGQMRRILANRTVDWKSFYELYDIASGLKEPEPTARPLGAPKYNIIKNVTREEANRMYIGLEEYKLPSGRSVIKLNENEYVGILE